jgi:NAD(P)-dependent dehydrogenase (short-subunit alcohol dehydrogenase family)
VTGKENGLDLSGKRAIVLGGTTGIGLATVRQLVEGGASVIAGSRSQENVATAATAVPEATFVTVDVLDRSGLEALFAQHEGFDLLVNAAYGGERAMGPFLQMDMDGFQGSFRKVWGYANSVRFGAPRMAAKGSIVLVSGFPARKSPPGISAVGAAGAAIESLVRSLAVEIAPLRINCVSPGVIDTPLLRVQGDARTAALERMTANFAIKRAGTADEVADAILFLLRNDYVTGTAVDVEGGALLP